MGPPLFGTRSRSFEHCLMGTHQSWLLVGCLTLGTLAALQPGALMKMAGSAHCDSEWHAPVCICTAENCDGHSLTPEAFETDMLVSPQTQPPSGSTLVETVQDCSSPCLFNMLQLHRFRMAICAATTSCLLLAAGLHPHQ